MKRIFYFTIVSLCLALAACSEYQADPGNHDVPGEKPETPSTSEEENPGNGFSSYAKLPTLSVQGRYLKNENGKIINLHGFTDTYSPYFDQFQWNNYDVNACLKYKKGIFEGIINAGWKLTFVRLHMDPYWSNKPGQQVNGEGDISAFEMERFKKYFDEVFLPMAEYYISKGLYVVMRPPGVCPELIEQGGAYHTYLKRVWKYVASHEKVKNNTDIMFELANEPVQIKGTDGNYSHWMPAAWEACSIFFQDVIDVIRKTGCTKNMVWVPGLCWQQQYKGYVSHPIKDANYGFAVHCYPGWYGSDSEGATGEGGGVTNKDYSSFKQGWDEQITPISKLGPVMVTEIDWAPAKYNKTWGKGVTGTAGGTGFGANFKKLADSTGNVSWLYFTTTSEDLRDFKDEPGTPGNYTFLNDPEACPWQMYHWFKEYAEIYAN